MKATLAPTGNEKSLIKKNCYLPNCLLDANINKFIHSTRSAPIKVMNNSNDIKQDETMTNIINVRKRMILRKEKNRFYVLLYDNIDGVKKYSNDTKQDEMMTNIINHRRSQEIEYFVQVSLFPKRMRLFHQ